MRWIVKKLSEITDVRDGTHDSPKQKPMGKKLVTSKHLINGKVNHESAYFISEEDFEKINQRSKVDQWDLLFAMIGTGTVGQLALISESSPDYAIKNVGLIKTKDKNLAKWLYFYLQSPKAKNAIDGLISGSSQPYISLGSLRALDIEIPPLPEQKAIASVLSSLDDKIDLLHRQNKTLEAMAETLFRQWFIEEAKEDWSEFYIRDLEIYIADYVANGSFASLKENVTLITERSDYALFIRNTDLKSNFANKVYVDEHSYNFLVKTKLYGGEVIISNVADVGSVHLCPRFNIPMTLGNNIIMLRSKFNYFLYLYFTSNVGQDALYAITSGSAQQKFNKTDFRALKISLPNLAILDEFNELVSPYFIKKEYNLNQIQTLENLRDTLLPKLMSGEVRVQNQTEEVA